MAVFRWKSAGDVKSVHRGLSVRLAGEWQRVLCQRLAHGRIWLSVTVPGVYRRCIETKLFITGLGCLSGLGTNIASHRAAVADGRSAFQPLAGWLGAESRFAELPASWIEPRSLLVHRKWSPSSVAALLVARQAVEEAGWSADDLRDAALVLGTSRGSAAGWLAPWPGRRPFKVMSASNTIHSEPAAAVSIELGIHGPYQVLASGCSAGLDAIGMAMMLVRSGVAPRALAVGVDLPLVPMLLESYGSSQLLARSSHVDPYHPLTAGFVPGEAAGAVAIDRAPGAGPSPGLIGYLANSDAADPVGMPRDGGRTADLVMRAVESFGFPQAICPHATGTRVHATAEPAALARAFPGARPDLYLLKPLTGHTIGASGMLESVIMAAFLREGLLPPNLPGLTCPPGFSLPDRMLPAVGPVFKISNSMGGHNALLALSPP
jgi:3-oxoacyl-[acyl-carrier-protein] synthase II